MSANLGAFLLPRPYFLSFSFQDIPGDRGRSIRASYLRLKPNRGAFFKAEKRPVLNLNRIMPAQGVHSEQASWPCWSPVLKEGRG